MKIMHTGSVKGQLYVPGINLFLYVGCLGTVLLFQSSGRMEAAYGLAITITMLTTTILLWRYMRNIGVSSWLTSSFVIVFCLLEGAFFAANMFKFVHGGWFTVLIACVLFCIMFVWNKGRSFHRSYLEYRYFPDYLDIVSAIRNDAEIPRYASNVVYISFSPIKNMVESKLLYSIINKQPKRADHYWIIRIEHTDMPYTLDYSVDTMVKDSIFLVTLRFGFKVQPRINVFLRQIVEDLAATGDLSLTSKYPSMKRYGIPGDFRFVLIHRIFSPASICNAYERKILAAYETLRHISESTENALGLDTSVVTVETVPLVIRSGPDIRIKRSQN